MRSVWCVLILLLILLTAWAGCVGPQPLQAHPSFALDAEGATGMAARFANGTVVTSSGRAPLTFTDVCDGPCPSVRLAVQLDDRDAQLFERLFVTVRWDGTQTAGFDVTSAGASELRRGHDALRLTFEPPLAGEWEIGLDGRGTYTFTARLAFSDSDSGRLLPNLVTLVPGGFRIPDGALFGAQDGCYMDERLEQGAERCLRLGNAVGNVGHGPLEVRLTSTEGALAVAGAGRYIQRIYTATGWEDQPVGGADLHLIHGHFHYSGLAEYRLFAYDTTTGLRGDEVGKGHKSGFCFIDWGEMEDSEVAPVAHAYNGVDCVLPATTEWYMGVSAGWYDLYSSGLTDQYVEVAGVPDGVYQLVSVADPADTLEEEDESDNAASVVLKLQGDKVEVLEVFGLYQAAPDVG